MFRIRFKKDIVAEFLPPAKKQKRQSVAIVYDGMPSVPKKKAYVNFYPPRAFGSSTPVTAALGKAAASF